ncbi:PIG-L family deacetylase [bacterium]|nr:PIG-L family deacetylase [bacterium]
MFESKKKVLILAPHTDDAEFGAGGTLRKFIESGSDVHIATFSNAVQSLPVGYHAETLLHESEQAANILGIPEANRRYYDFNVRYFPSVRQEILEVLVKIQRELEPDVVLVPSRLDIHQDHQTIAQEGFRAFKLTTILGYELPWNTIETRSHLIIRLDETHINCKVEALGKYESQQHKPYASEDFVRAWARSRGVTVSATYAEAFEVLRWVV